MFFIIKHDNKRLKNRQKACNGKSNMDWCIVAIQCGMNKSKNCFDRSSEVTEVKFLISNIDPRNLWWPKEFFLTWKLGRQWVMWNHYIVALIQKSFQKAGIYRPITREKLENFGPARTESVDQAVRRSLPNKFVGNNKKHAVAWIAYVNVRMTENIIWQTTKNLSIYWSSERSMVLICRSGPGTHDIFGWKNYLKSCMTLG